MIRRAFLVSAVLFLVALPAFAREELTVYYEGCGSSSYYVGDKLRSCAGGTTYTGQQSGHWKWVSWYDCSSGEITNFYYERCGTQWIPVSESAFLGPCSC
ncbi:MAG TPA: hypothetical protein VHK90_17695 [Thermoanaerobaculia bacterium]|nr:hypothetical protein [Thermoanaerobaculia bacterium]